MTIKRQLIMEKALDLFAEQGFEATSVQQITDRCGISKGAFYLSFKSKDELIAALIDNFSTQFTSSIDYLVRNTENDDELLYTFFLTIFESFQKHSNFAKILFKEQMQTFNEEFIDKMRTYDQMTQQTILLMIERLYGEKISHTKYDLVFCIKGFMKMYSELFLFYSAPLDLDLLARSLVEKTHLLATRLTTPFITNELYEHLKLPSFDELSIDQIVHTIEQTLEDMEPSIEKESLVLLKNDLLDPLLKPPLIKGLLANIEQHPQCSWAAYLLRLHFGFQ